MKPNEIKLNTIENFSKNKGLDLNSPTFRKFAATALDFAMSGMLEDNKEYDETSLLRAMLFCSSNDISLCNKEAYLLPFSVKKEGKPTGKFAVTIQIDYKYLRQMLLVEFPPNLYKIVEIELKEGDEVNQIFDIGDINFGNEIVKFKEKDSSKRRGLNTFAYYAAIVSIAEKRVIASYVAYCESVRSTINEMKSLSPESKSKYEPKFQNENVHFAKFALRKLADRIPKGNKLRQTINAEDFNFSYENDNEILSNKVEDVEIEIVEDSINVSEIEKKRRVNASSAVLEANNKNQSDLKYVKSDEIEF
jgi:hypothetical protein